VKHQAGHPSQHWLIPLPHPGLAGVTFEVRAGSVILGSVRGTGLATEAIDRRREGNMEKCRSLTVTLETVTPQFWDRADQCQTL